MVAPILIAFEEKVFLIVFDFEEGEEYEICFDIASNGRPSANVVLKAVRGLSVAGSSGGGTTIIPDNYVHETIYAEELDNLHTPTGNNNIAPNTYVRITTSYIPTDNFTALWVYPHLPYGPTGGNVPPGSNYQASMSVDNFIIRKVNQSQYGISPDALICDEDIQLYASGGQQYTWTSISGDPVSTLSCDACSNPIASPANTTTYAVEIVDTNFCNPVTREVTITVDCDQVCIPDPDFSFTNEGCNTYQFSGTENGMNTTNQFLWDFGDPASGVNNQSSLQNPIHLFTSLGSYEVCLTTTCENFQSQTFCQTIVVNTTLSPISVSTSISNPDCENNPCGYSIDLIPDAGVTLPITTIYTNLNSGIQSNVTGTTINNLCQGTYQIQMTDANCGIFETELEISCSPCLNASINMIDYDGCEGDGYSIDLEGITYNENNPTGSDTLYGQSFDGCDSILIVDLTFSDCSCPPSVLDTTYTGCEGDGFSITLNGILYDENNPTGNDTLTAQAFNGCDSIIQVDLSFQNCSCLPSILDTSYVGCEGDGFNITLNGIFV